MPPPSAPPPKKSLGTPAPKKAAEKKQPEESSDDSSDESGESSPVVSGSGECLRNRKMKKLFPLKQDGTKALWSVHPFYYSCLGLESGPSLMP